MTEPAPQGQPPSRQAVARMLEQVEGLYRLGGPAADQRPGPMDPASWHGRVLAELDDVANMDPPAWAAAARGCRFDNAAGVRALVRLSAAAAVAAALRYALGAVEAATGEPASPEAVLDEIAAPQWWADVQPGATDAAVRRPADPRPAAAASPAPAPDESDRLRRLIRCPNARNHLDVMEHVDYLHRSSGDNDDSGWTARGRAQTARLLDELDRRRWAGGPLFLRPDGRLGRADPDDFLEQALAAMPPDDQDVPDPPLADVLHSMGIDNAEAVRAFRRLIAVQAATTAVRWASVPAVHAGAVAQELLTDLDSPSGN